MRSLTLHHIGSNHAADETKNKMTTESTIKDAIARSVSHTEIVRVEVTWPTDSRSAEETILDWLDKVEGTDAVDCTQENDGSYDVWGTVNGDDFRLRLVTA